MKATPSADSEREYIAFISYRHLPLDMEAARKVQKKIENFTVPRELRAQAGGKKLGMVFRDEDELPASASLSGSITYALDHSRFLIVICTPDLPMSKWCEQEIRYFLQTHDRDHVLAVLADGEPQQSFSPLLLHTFDEQGNITGDTEPLAANIAGPGHRINSKAFGKESVRICAALLGCPFDALWQRQKRARTNRMLAAMAAAMAVMAVFAGVVFSKNRQITRQNARITEQNEEITEKNTELKRQMSSILVDTGRSQLEDHDVLGALRSALDALPEERKQPYDHGAEGLLAEALGAYRSQSLQSRLLFTQSTDIVDLAVTRDGARALLADPAGFVRCVSLQNGSLLWETLARSKAVKEDAALDLLMADKLGLVLCKSETVVRALSLEDGSTVWEYLYSDSLGNNFYCLSPDCGTLVIYDQMNEDTGEITLLALDSATGQELGQVTVGSEELPVARYGTYYSYHYAASFSSDGKLFGFSQQIATEPKDACFCALIDARSWKLLHTQSCKISPNSPSPIFCGIHTQNGSGDLFCILYDYGYGGIMTAGICWESGEVTRDLTNKTLSSENGLNIDVLTEYSRVPMLTSDHLAVAFVQESMYIYDLHTGELRRGYAFQDEIISAAWESRAEEKLVLITAGGVVARYDFEHGSNTVLNTMGDVDLDQSSIAMAKALSGQEILQYLTVSRAQPGKLMAVRQITDPSGETIPVDPDGTFSRYRILPSPSGDKLFFFCPGRDALSVLVLDAETREELARAELDINSWDIPVVLGDDRFLLGYTVYRLDGSAAELELPSGTSFNGASSSYASSLALSDGQVLTIFDSPFRSKSEAIPCWLNGEPFVGAENLGVGFSRGYRDPMLIGANGFVAGYGEFDGAVIPTAAPAQSDEADGTQDEIHEVLDPDDDELPATSKVLYFCDIGNGQVLTIPDPLPDSAEHHILLGSRTPVLACWDEQGQICLASLSDGSVRPLSASYHPGELCALCFTPDDRCLAVLTASGRLDIYDLDGDVLLFSQVPSFLRNVDMSYINELSCQTDRSGTRLLFTTDYIGNTYGYFFVVDTEQWLILAQSSNVYAYLPADGGVYAKRWKSLVRYPLHTVDDLAAMAEEQLK